jgi:hypothetical protein
VANGLVNTASAAATLANALHSPQALPFALALKSAKPVANAKHSPEMNALAIVKSFNL